MAFSNRSEEQGQGLVEYALILVLVAIVVIAVLQLVGPAVGNVFSRVTTALGRNNAGVITGVSAARTGGGNGNDVKVTITVSTTTSVTAADSQSGQSQTAACNGSCIVTLTGVGHQSGTVTVTAAAGGTRSTTYPAKP